MSCFTIVFTCTSNCQLIHMSWMWWIYVNPNFVNRELNFNLINLWYINWIIIICKEIISREYINLDIAIISLHGISISNYWHKLISLNTSVLINRYICLFYAHNSIGTGSFYGKIIHIGIVRWINMYINLVYRKLNCKTVNLW